MPHVRHSHCSYCGGAFKANHPWPRTCAHCSNISYVNPLPVAVVLLPVDDGLLLVRRNIEPGLGKLALPGGYLDLGETWQEGAARELFEETGVRTRASRIREFRVLSSPAGQLVVFGLAEAISARRLPEFAANGEATEMVVETRPRRLAFPLHTRVMREFFHTAKRVL